MRGDDQVLDDLLLAGLHQRVIDAHALQVALHRHGDRHHAAAGHPFDRNLVELGLHLGHLRLQLAGLLTIAGVVGVARYYTMRSQLYREVETSANNLIQVMEETLAERHTNRPYVSSTFSSHAIQPADHRVAAADARGARRQLLLV